MNNQYNLYNLEALFEKYLLAGNSSSVYTKREFCTVSAKADSGSGQTTIKPGTLSPITIKNYLSDLRHFLGWMTLKLKVKNEKLKIETLSEAEFTQFITPEIILNYKQYLISNNIPLKTVNRRLSTLRKVCSFCISQGWMRENPAKKIFNQKKPLNIQISKKNKQTLNKFSRELYKSGFSKATIKNYLSDVQEFLNVISFNH